MSEFICLKQLIDEEDFEKINELKTICINQENMFLKLELEFKLNISLMQKQESFDYVNEFFYYSGETLVGYLGIFSLGGETGELTGMVHPLYRRKGTFLRLYNLAREECKRRNMRKVLLVCDKGSSSGLAFIEATGAAYSFSEYEMKVKLDKKYISQKEKSVVLRKAVNSDADEIAKQDYICFGNRSGTEMMPEDDEKRNRITYMIETDSRVIGKIRVELNADDGFISGFGILPEYRNRGYGRQALKAALDLLNENNARNVALEVAAHNKNALNLYRSCGFVEESVTDYYEVQ
ncbi:putative N-acetyltransferase YycN [Peptococcaceae bacterium CEB3]|nr:putative N-acetyltransferase YycN [Peptococcaceae bacterium CEB3]